MTSAPSAPSLVCNISRLLSLLLPWRHPSGHHWLFKSSQKGFALGSRSQWITDGPLLSSPPPPSVLCCCDVVCAPPSMAPPHRGLDVVWQLFIRGDKLEGFAAFMLFPSSIAVQGMPPPIPLFPDNHTVFIG